MYASGLARPEYIKSWAIQVPVARSGTRELAPGLFPLLKG